MNLKRRDNNRTKNRLNQTAAALVCKDCSKMFTINIGEICWHYDVGNLIPQFCPDCRKKRKEERLQKRNERKQNFVQAEENLTEENLVGEI